MPHAHVDTRKRSPHADAPLERARLTLHDADPITGNEDTLSSLFYEFHRGYTAADSVERYLPQEEYVWLNWRKLQRKPTLSRPMRPVS